MKVGFRILIIILVFLFWLPFALYRGPSPSIANQVQSFDKNWEFAWDNQALKTEEILKEPSVLHWSPYTIGQDLEGKSDIDSAWFRVRLPDSLPIHPALSAYGIDHSYQMFIDGELRDSIGVLPMEKGDFEGFFRLIRIPLKEIDAGKVIYLKVSSNWVNIGISINVFIGRESDLILYKFRIYDFIVLMMFAFTFLLGVFSTTFAMFLKEKQLFQLGCFQICLGIVCLMESHLTTVLWNYPLLNTILLHACIVISPYFLLGFFLEYLDKKERKILEFYQNIYFLYIIYSISYSAIFHIDKKFDYFVGKPGWFLLGCNFIILFYVFAKNKNYKKPDVILFLIGLGSLMLGMLPQLLWEFKIIRNYPRWYFHWSLIGFIISIAVILFRKVSFLYSILINAKKELEKQVEEQSRKMQMQQQSLIQMERSLAAKKERESILSDIHDELGQRVFDLKMLAKRIQTDLPENNPNSALLLESTESILKGLRSKVQSSDDIQLMNENFSLGIRTFLFHRYELHNRQIILDLQEEALDWIETNRFFQQQFIQMLREVTSNDLRYGSRERETEMHIRMNNNKLFVDFVSMSTYINSLEKKLRKSRGSESLLMRVSKLHGKIKESILDGIYELHFVFEI